MSVLNFCFFYSILRFLFIISEIVGFYPKGNPSRNSQRPGQNPGLRGGLEIVFNQQ
ncbi:hypothetical protein V6Z11_D10G076900 [Gossypium hirsutum]